MTQTARPVQDIFQGSWTPTPLWPQIGGVTPNTATPDTSSNNPVHDALEVKLSAVAYPGPGSQTLTVQLRQTAAGNLGVTIALVQGNQIIASTVVQPTQSFANYTLTLSQQQISQITDYSNLHVRVTADTCIGSNSVHGSQTYSTNGTYNWTCPTGVVCVQVQAWGAGGGGAGTFGFNGAGNCGGGGGGYMLANNSVTAGNIYPVVVGQGGTGGIPGGSGSNGGSSYFNTTSAGAAGGGTGGGIGGAGNGGTGGGGSGGLVAHKGGNGGNNALLHIGGAGGGGGAGSNGNGASAANSSGNNGTAGGAGGTPDGGNGGNGGNQGFNGNNGNSPGGGGGGAGGLGNFSGGAGSDGQVILTW